MLTLIAQGQKTQAAVPGEDRVVELPKFGFVAGRKLDFFDNNPEAMAAALSNPHEFVPERVFIMGSGDGANNLTGAAVVPGDFISRNASSKDKPAQLKSASTPDHHDRTGGMTHDACSVGTQ